MTSNTRVNLYHYTSLKNFKIIWNTHKLLMNNISKVKDSTEVKACEELLSACNLNNHIEEIKKTRDNSYICCFSTNEYNEKLWHNYSEDGNGVVICFHPLHIEPLLDGFLMGDSKPDGSDWKRSTQIQLIRTRYLDNDCEYLNNLAKDKIDFLMIVGDAYKSKEYSYEDEIRLVMYYKSGSYPDYSYPFDSSWIYHQILMEEQQFYYDLLSYRVEPQKLKKTKLSLHQYF